MKSQYALSMRSHLWREAAEPVLLIGDLQGFIVEYEDGTEEERCFNIRAKASDCVLLPEAGLC